MKSKLIRMYTMENRPNEIQNLKGCHLLVYEDKDRQILHMGNDWNICQDFEFDNKEQLDQLIQELVKLSERLWEKNLMELL